MPEDRERLDLGIGDDDEIEIILDEDDDGLPPSVGVTEEGEEETGDDVELLEVEDLTEETDAGALRSEVEELRDKYLRKLAEFDNYRKRTEREREELIDAAGERVVLELIPVLDNFERALQHAPADDPFHQGVVMIFHQLWETLQREGLDRMDPLGQEFEPEFHEAVQRIEDTDADPGTVVAVMAKGYLFAGKLVRPAMVAVAVSPAPSVGEPDDE
jgi:molecular chaperone GrpE